MAMFYSDNPVADAERHFNALETAYDKAVKCTECSRVIQSDKCYVLNRKPYCQDCIYESETEEFEK